MEGGGAIYGEELPGSIALENGNIGLISPFLTWFFKMETVVVDSSPIFFSRFICTELILSVL